MKSAMLVLAAALPFAVTAQIPTPVVPQGVGVNIHFVTGHERDLDLIAAAGFKFVRMDFAWTALEKEQGKYDWSGYDELTANLEKRGLRALYIFDYSHLLYEETVEGRNPITHQMHQTTASPQHPESVAAFARWAAAAAKHFAGRKIIWEIWNEPNIQFWQPKPDAHQYATLALATCKAIRAADPHAIIVGPAASTFPWAFLETVFQSGALEYFDAVSVHPYRNPSKPPETAAADYVRLRELIDRYAPATPKGKIAILSGEWGYSSNTKGVSLETQAAFAVRQQLFNLLEGIPLSIWYDWKNDGDDPKENEHNFGTVLPDLQPKPAYLAIQKLTRELSGYQIATSLQLTNRDDFALLMINPKQERKLVSWTAAQPHTATVKVFLEQELSLSLELTAMPQYVNLAKPRRDGKPAKE
jgi:hypothetical protein